MAELMTWADIGISAAGSTCWELAYAGLPSILLVLAENQRELAEGLKHKDAAINLGWHGDNSEREIALEIHKLVFDRQRRSNLSQNARKMVDGLGPTRVCESIIENTTRHSLTNNDDQWRYQVES